MTQRIWKNPIEVPLSEMRAEYIVDQEKYAFFKDVEARMAETISAAIRYEFPDRKTAEGFQGYAANKYRDRYGAGKIRCRLKDLDGVVYVYFAPMKPGGKGKKS